jgi:hypothetical protein
VHDCKKGAIYILENMVEIRMLVFLVGIKTNLRLKVFINGRGVAVATHDVVPATCPLH